MAGIKEEKARSNRAKIEPYGFIDFSTNPTADEGARSHEKEEKKERKEEKDLPQASAASSAPIFDVHEYRRSRLQRKKSRGKEREEGRWRVLGGREHFIEWRGGRILFGFGFSSPMESMEEDSHRSFFFCFGLGPGPKWAGYYKDHIKNEII